jgi:hypothetical protein
MRSALVPMVAWLLLWTAPCAAALYEFTLEGTVTYSLFGFDPAVGERCVIRYVADTLDLEPDPDFGYFAATPPVVVFPDSNTLIPFVPSESTNLFVSNSHSGTFDHMGYQSFGVPGAAWILSLTLIFPDGIIVSDALPHSVPLEHALSANFFITPVITDVVRGRITSYRAVAVPETSTLWTTFLSGWAISISRRRRVSFRACRCDGQ